MRLNPYAEDGYTLAQVVRATVWLFWHEQRGRWADRFSVVRRALSLYVRTRVAIARSLRLCPSIPEAFRRHLLFPPRSVQIQVRPGCAAASKPVAPGQAGQVTVALHGLRGPDTDHDTRATRCERT